MMGGWTMKGWMADKWMDSRIEGGRTERQSDGLQDGLKDGGFR